MAIANVVTELLVIVKFSKGEAYTRVPVPSEVKAGERLVFETAKLMMWM